MRNPNISMLISLSQEFAVSIDYLILGTPSSTGDVNTLVSAIRKGINLENQAQQKQHGAPISASDYQLIVEILHLLAG